MCSVYVYFHTVVRTGENALLRLVKEELFKQRNLYHCTSTCILCAELIIVLDSIESLKQSIVDGRSVVTHCLFAELVVNMQSATCIYTCSRNPSRK